MCCLPIRTITASTLNLTQWLHIDVKQHWGTMLTPRAPNMSAAMGKTGNPPAPLSGVSPSRKYKNTSTWPCQIQIWTDGPKDTRGEGIKHQDQKDAVQISNSVVHQGDHSSFHITTWSEAGLKCVKIICIIIQESLELQYL